jgi:hypothetical protein
MNKHLSHCVLAAALLSGCSHLGSELSKPVVHTPVAHGPTPCSVQSDCAGAYCGAPTIVPVGTSVQGICQSNIQVPGCEALVEEGVVTMVTCDR